MARKNENPGDQEVSSGDPAFNEEQEKTSEDEDQVFSQTVAEATPPQEREQQNLSSNEEGGVIVISETRKGKTVSAVTGKPIVFDNEGKAKVSKADAEYLKNCLGFEIR